MYAINNSRTYLVAQFKRDIDLIVSMVSFISINYSARLISFESVEQTSLTEVIENENQLHGSFVIIAALLSEFSKL